MPTSALTIAPLAVSGVSHVFDNFPQIGTILWLDATKIAGISSGASLSVWTDSSASLSHASQPSATSQAVYLTNVQNGNSALSFIGVQTYNSNTSLTQPCTIGVVFSASKIGNSNRVVSGRANGPTILLKSGTGEYSYYAGTGPVTILSSTTNQWVYEIGIFSGSSSTGEASGTSRLADAGSNSGLTLSIGGNAVSTETFFGHIGEVVVYNRAITDNERLSLGSYFKAKWATL